MGKKNAKVLAKDKKQFVEAATKNGYSEQNAGELFENLIPFASYKESISADVSVVKISWQSAYFKTHYPKEFDEAIRLSGYVRQ